MKSLATGALPRASRILAVGWINLFTSLFVLLFAALGFFLYIVPLTFAWLGRLLFIKVVVDILFCGIYMVVGAAYTSMIVVKGYVYRRGGRGGSSVVTKERWRKWDEDGADDLS